MAAYVRDPRPTRTAASVVAVVAASDVLHQAWIALDQRI